MKLQFHGAARQVTGSMFQITLDDGYNILIDCGLNYEKGVKREDNAKFPFEPFDIDVVLLTHAHLDHSGNLPTLYNRGFAGKVFCTEPTWTLCDLLLMDSANLEASRIRRMHKKKGKKGVGHRLYGYGDVRDAVNNMITLTFQQVFEIRKGVKVTFIPAGHILGAASVILDIDEQGKTKRLAFSGDLGSNDSLITVDPEIPENVDYLIMESTYGARFHTDFGNGEDVLEKYIKETCIEQGGRLVIPAFSVGRTQAILYAINRLFRARRLPPVTVFADSPMGITSSGIHDKYSSYLNEESAKFLDLHHDLFRFKQLYVVEDKDDVEHMETHNGPSVIVSSAGMLEGGRIQKHVKFNLSNSHSTILIAGYCIPGTLGHSLLQGDPQVKIQGQSYPVFSKVASTDAFSAHPDQTGLLEYHEKVKTKGKLKTTFLVHGDEAGLEAIHVALSKKNNDVIIPELSDSIVL
jgi:metallo-beta-lactamase family protein